MLYVRHGETATTGTLLPGRAPGLHLSDTGRQQAEAACSLASYVKPISAGAIPAAFLALLADFIVGWLERRLRTP